MYNQPAYAVVQARLTTAMFEWYLQVGLMMFRSRVGINVVALQTSDVTPWDEVTRATPTGNWSLSTIAGSGTGLTAALLSAGFPDAQIRRMMEEALQQVEVNRTWRL